MQPDPKEATFAHKTLRNWKCPHYDECLDKIYKLKWTAWDCSECDFKNSEKEIEFHVAVNDNLSYKFHPPKGREYNK